MDQRDSVASIPALPEAIVARHAVLLVAVPLLAAGCAHMMVSPGWHTASLPRIAIPGGLWSKPAGLPDRTELLAGQLVIHADFPLAGQHRLVRELESLRTEVSQRLGLPISDEPIHLYLFETPERFEAFVAREFPTFPSRRAFFVVTDTSLSVFAAWQDRVAEDLRHETTHGYVHAVVPAIPLWLDEGIAEYFELPRSDRGVHAAHVAHLAGRLIEGTWQPDVAKLEALASAGELSQDHYAEAWAWVHWLLDTTPERRALLEEYIADIRRDPATPPLSLRLRQLSGNAAAEVKAHVEALAASAGHD